MGIVLGIPIFLFCIFGPAFFVLRSKKGTPKQRNVWAAFTVIGAFAFAGIIGLAAMMIGKSFGLSAVEQRFGWLGDVSIVGTVGFFALPWILYAVFRRKHGSQDHGSSHQSEQARDGS